MSWDVGEISGVLQRWSLRYERWRSPDFERLRICDARRQATWRESSSTRSSSPAVLSGVAGEMLAVVGWVVISQILYAKWEAELGLPSVWPTSVACTCGGRRLPWMVRRKSFGTSVVRPLRCRMNCDGFRSPISSFNRSYLTRCSR